MVVGVESIARLKAAMAIVGQFSRCKFVAEVGIGGGEPGVQADRR